MFSSIFKALSQSVALFPSWIRLARHAPDSKSPFFHEWGNLGGEAVVREDYLQELCRGRRVLHFGFVDAPFSEERIKNRSLLHQKLQDVASHVFGLDIDQQSLETYRKLTGDRENGILDVTAPQLPDAPFLKSRYDLILFPEVLEHLLNPAMAMSNLRQICAFNPGARLCITTPNAYSIIGFHTAMTGNELVHPDHYFYFSPATLRKLMKDTGFTDIELKLYTQANLLRSPGLTKHGLIATALPSSK